MSRAVSKIALRLYTLIPKDGSAASEALREALNLTDGEYACVRQQLLDAEMIRPARGPGKRVQRVRKEERELLSFVPHDGSAISSVALRRSTLASRAVLRISAASHSSFAP